MNDELDERITWISFKSNVELKSSRTEKKLQKGDAWVAQWLRSAFGSGHDPRVLESSPVSGSTQKQAPSPSASVSASLSLSVCVS